MTEQDLLKCQNLIYYIASNFSNYPNKEDLYQVGYIGLLNAYKNFQDDKNTKFSTYAYTYILGEMKKLVREDRSIKVGRDLMKLSLKIEKASILLTQKLGHIPTALELSAYLEIPYDVVSLAINSNSPIIRMDNSYTDDKQTDLYEVVEDKKEDLDTKLMLDMAVDSLSDFEQELIRKRYVEDLTQTEVANFLGISQVQVSRKETKVLNKLKTKLKI